jgi:hypothetical protein
VKSWRPKPQSVFIAATHAGTLTHTHSLLRPFHKRRVRTFIFSFSQRRTLAWPSFYHTMHFRCAFYLSHAKLRADRPTALRCLWPAVVFLRSPTHQPALYIHIGRQRTHIFPATIIGYQLHACTWSPFIYFAWRGAHSSKSSSSLPLVEFKDGAEHWGLK